MNWTLTESDWKSIPSFAGTFNSVGINLTLQRQLASHTGSLCGRSASWPARNAWRRWACRRLCAEAQTLGSGWPAPSRVAAVGTVSAPWPPAGRWRRRSHPPCGTPSGCGGSHATPLTKPWIRGEERKGRSFKFRQASKVNIIFLVYKNKNTFSERKYIFYVAFPKVHQPSHNLFWTCHTHCFAFSASF